MSSSGKSTLVGGRLVRGYRAVDLSDHVWPEYRELGVDEVPPVVRPGRDWSRREERIAVLPRAPVSATLVRLVARAPNSFGT